MRKPSPFFKEEFLEHIVPLFMDSMKNIATANEYYSYVCQLCDYLEKDFLEITELDVQKYYEDLLSRYYKKELSRKTINVRFAAFKRLASFICEENLCKGYTNFFTAVKKIPTSDDVAVTQIISMSDLDKIMSAAKSDEMMYLILALAGRCAFTLSDIISLKEKMIQILDGRVYVTFPRKNEYATADVRMLPADVSKLMEAYLEKVIFLSPEKYLFYNKHGKPITRRNIDSAVERLVKKAALEHRYTIKDIRSRCIVDMKNAGLPEDIIADYTSLQVQRIRNYDNAARAAKECPADLVNYQLKS